MGDTTVFICRHSQNQTEVKIFKCTRCGQKWRGENAQKSLKAHKCKVPVSVSPKDKLDSCI